jgi:hypothetical protein
MARFILKRPHDAKTGLIWHLNYSFIGNVYPFSINTNSVMAVLSIPIGVIYAPTFGKIATQPLAAPKSVEPFMQVWI